MGGGDPCWCPTLRPTRHEFSKPFTQYVEEAFKANPGAPMLKIVPPKGWTPRTAPFPNLDDIRISTPIKQHVFGTKGAYRCLLEEQRGMSVADFKKLAYREDHQAPRQGHREDALLERAFWSSITLSPPYYGADTPFSFFDQHLRFGWNLRGLNCLLSQHDMPAIPGVTTPMTYFGMWKSFFSWHIEDVDLYSINYLHFGAPKVWYSVSPNDRGKFENMAQQLYPELARNCKAFLRHKDILISPRVLRAFNVPFQQARQEVGEFIVLSAAAYHSGFNQGFNCAEAVNFALPDWLPLGRKATRCTCSALDDAVRLDMRLFRPEGEVWSDVETSSDEEDEEDSDAEDVSGSEEAASSAVQEEASSGAESESDAESDSAASSQTNASEGHATGGSRQSGHGAPASRSGRRQAAKPRGGAAAAAAAGGRGGAGAAAGGKAGGSKSRSGRARPVVDAAGNVDMDALNALMPGKMGRPFKSAENAARAGAKMLEAANAALQEAIDAASRKGRPFKNPDNEAKAIAKRASTLVLLQRKAQQAKKFATAAQQAAAAAAGGVKRSGSRKQQAVTGVKRVRAGSDEASPPPKRATPPSSPMSGRAARGAPARRVKLEEEPRRPKRNPWPHVRDELPFVIVGQDDSGTKYFYMVQKVEGIPITVDGVVSLQWLAEGKDGIYRPTAGVYQEKVGALIPVRTQPVATRGRKEGGYKLLTPREHILDTQLID